VVIGGIKTALNGFVLDMHPWGGVCLLGAPGWSGVCPRPAGATQGPSPGFQARTIQGGPGTFDQPKL